MSPRTYKGIESLLKTRSLEMTTLYELSKILGSSLDIRVTVNSALKVLANFHGIKKVAVAEYTKETKSLRIVYAYGYTRDEVKNSIFKLGEGTIGNAAKSGVPVVISENPTLISVPVKARNRLYGILYLERPFSDNISVGEELRFLTVVASMISHYIHLSRQAEEKRQKLVMENVELRERIEKRASIEGIIGISPQMDEVFQVIKRVAPTNSIVLIRGESGTGKELVARALHSLSKRKDGPFIKVNCPAIPETLLESELFGHEKGAFTGAIETRKGRFEIANKGTLFLDEIGDLGPSMQAKILRFIQEGVFERVGSSKPIKVDVRLIAATNRDLESLIDEGKFRQDLYFRLNVVPVLLPPLRERKEDIPLLIEHFLEIFNSINGKSVKLTERALKVLLEYPWPGNVRELENCIERLVVLSDSDTADQSHLPLPVSYPVENKTLSSISRLSTKSLTLNEIERNAILDALKESGWKQKDAAKKLGLSPRQLNYKLKKYKIVKTYKNV